MLSQGIKFVILREFLLMGNNLPKKGSSYYSQFQTSHLNVTLFLRYSHGIKQSSFWDSSEILNTQGANGIQPFGVSERLKYVMQGYNLHLINREAVFLCSNFLFDVETR